MSLSTPAIALLAAPSSSAVNLDAIDLNGVSVSSIAPLDPKVSELLHTTIDPIILDNHLGLFSLCLAKVHYDLIKPHPHQRKVELRHVRKLVSDFGDHGPSLMPKNYATLVAIGSGWNWLYHNLLTPITVHRDSGLTALCLRGNHRIEALRQWSKGRKSSEEYWTCWVLRPEFNDVQPTLLNHYIIKDNTGTQALLTSFNTLLTYVTKHVTLIYHAQKAPLVGVLVHHLTITSTHPLAKLVRFPAIMASLDKLLEEIPFFPDWREDLTPFLSKLLECHSEKAVTHFLDGITSSLVNIKAACSASEDFKDGFTLSETVPLPFLNLQEHRSLKEARKTNVLSSLRKLPTIFSYKSLDILTRAFEGVDPGLYGFGHTFFTPAIIKESNLVKAYFNDMNRLHGAACFILCGPAKYSIACMNHYRMEWPIPESKHYDGAIGVYAQENNLVDRIFPVLTERSSDLTHEWISSDINGMKVSLNITSNMQVHIDWVRKIEEILLSKSEAWYNLLLYIGILPGDELPCSKALPADAPRRAYMPTISPHLRFGAQHKQESQSKQAEMALVRKPDADLDELPSIDQATEPATSSGPSSLRSPSPLSPQDSDAVRPRAINLINEAVGRRAGLDVDLLLRLLDGFLSLDKKEHERLAKVDDMAAMLIKMGNQGVSTSTRKGKKRALRAQSPDDSPPKKRNTRSRHRQNSPTDPVPSTSRVALEGTSSDE